MSKTTAPQSWDRFKNVIRRLRDTHILEGQDGLIKIMEEKYGFKATKSQYEKKFKEWGFQKRRKKDDYKILSGKIEKRKRQGKETAVYFDGELIPSKKLNKELSRQGYMTFREQLMLSQGSPPQTPQGFTIRTPSNPPIFRLIFENLPLFQVHEAVDILTERIEPFEPSSTALTWLLGKDLGQTTDIFAHPILESLLPTHAFREEASASAFALERVDRLGSTPFLNLTIFLLSNNLPGESQGDEILKWLKENGAITFLDQVSLMKIPSADSLLENLFRLAVEAGDSDIALRLLSTGIDPNGHRCELVGIPDTMTPLQLACITGQTALARELIRAGAAIDEPGAEWKSSALVLAITGYYVAEEQYWLEAWIEFPSRPSHDDSPGGDREDELLSLVNDLIDAGASINPVDSYVPSSDIDPDHPLQDYQSPLTIASKFLLVAVVRRLLEEGAEVNFVTDRGTSALHECIYSWQDMSTDYVNQSQAEESKMINIVRVLLESGANIEFIASFETPRWCDDDYESEHEEIDIDLELSPIDCAIKRGSILLVQVLLDHGAPFTAGSLTRAVKSKQYPILNLLLNTMMENLSPMTANVVNAAIKAWDYLDEKTKGHLLWCQESLTQQQMATAAIRFGASSLLSNLFLFENVTLTPCFELMQAIEECCEKGYLTVLRQILNSRFRSAVVSSLGRALSNAISSAHYDLFDILLSAGADVNAANPNGYLALLCAIENRQEDAVLKLIEAGAALNRPCKRRLKDATRGHFWHTTYGDALIMAILWGKSAVIENLLKAGADINALGESRSGVYECECITPLTAAIIAENWNLVQYLLDAGCDVNNNPRASFKLTPLAAAIRSKHTEILQWILEAGANPLDAHALQEAVAHKGKLEKILSNISSLGELDSHNNVGLPAFQMAVQQGKTEAIKALFHSHLLDIDSLSYTIQKPRGWRCLFGALENENAGITKLILSLGADPNSSTYVKWCEEYMSDATLREEYMSALSLAVIKRNEEKIHLLLAAGALPNQTFAEMKLTPLQRAVEDGLVDISLILLQHGADPNAISPDGPGHTPLQLAAREGSKELVELLLEYGADVDAPPAKEYGATALQFAAIGGYIGIAYILLKYEADINTPPADFEGRTALEGAAEHGRMDMVQILLNAGCLITGDGHEQYKRALERASGNGHHAVRRLLERHYSQYYVD